MKKYEAPKLELLSLSVADVICASAEGLINGGGADLNGGNRFDGEIRFD